MSKNLDYDSLFDKIKKIIRNNTPEDSILKISKFKSPITGEKFGIKKAFEIYKINIDYSVEYDKKLYANNVSLWNKRILRNLKLANEAYDNIK